MAPELFQQPRLDRGQQVVSARAGSPSIVSSSRRAASGPLTFDTATARFSITTGVGASVRSSSYNSRMRRHGVAAGSGSRHGPRRWPPGGDRWSGPGPRRIDRGAEAERNQPGIPLRAILILEQHQLARSSIRASRRAAWKAIRATRAWAAGALVAGGVGNQPAEPQRFPAQIEANQFVATMRRVAFVEEQIDHFEDGIEARGNSCGGGRSSERPARGSAASRAPAAARSSRPAQETRGRFRRR